MTVILNSLSGNSYTSVSFKSVSEIYFVPLIGPFFLIFVFLVTFYDIHEFEKTATSSSLYGLVLYGKDLQKSAWLNSLWASQTISVVVSSL